MQCELRKWVLVLVLLIVVGGRCGDRRRLDACTPCAGCRGETTGSRREIYGFVLQGNYKYFISEKSKNVVWAVVWVYLTTLRDTCAS
jgi:hypothetical protein